MYEMGAYTTMTSKGQFAKQVREQLSLTAGPSFYVTVRDGEVVALPKNKRIADLGGIPGRPPSGETLTVDQMNEAVMDTAAEDDERVTRKWHEGVE
jgi:antitoxin PrlF